MHAPRIAGVGATSAFGRGVQALHDGVFAGRAVFRAVDRFPVEGRRAQSAAAIAGRPDLESELVAVIDEACAHARLGAADRARTPLLLAVHAQPTRASVSAGAMAAAVATSAGLSGAMRTYTNACVAGTSALADAAAMIRAGACDRVVVAAGYLVESDQFALFDAGRALAGDATVRPFSAGRKGMVLGDAVSAIVVESSSAGRSRGTEPFGLVAGWGRAGDAYHVCQPRPDGAGVARAIAAALRRADIDPRDVGYVNAHGTGTTQSDAAEAAGLRLAFGPDLSATSVSSTKSLHGHALEASGLLEVVITLLALRAGKTPVNAGFLGPDAACDLNLVLDAPGRLGSRFALSINSAFGGANTAVVVGAA